MTPQWSPSDQQVRAAETLFLAMANADQVREAVTAYETQVLERLQLRVSDQMAAYLPKMAGAMVLRRQDLALLSCDDMDRFNAARVEAMHKAGFSPTPPFDCPLLQAEEIQREAENGLLIAMEPVTNLDQATVARLHGESRRRVIDLTLRLLSPRVSTAAEILNRHLTGR